VAIADIDTRRLTRLLRQTGAQNGCIVAPSGRHPDRRRRDRRRGGGREGGAIDGRPGPGEGGQHRHAVRVARPPSGRSAPAAVCSEPRFHVVAYDFGVKRNILRMLASRGCRVTVVPAQTTAAEVLALKPDGIFLSNGPGDPEPCDYAIAAARELIESGMPTFGICLGHQIMALASGAKTFKMKFGHHGANHPVKDLDSGRVSITSQNHGFAVDEAVAAGQPAAHPRQPVRRHAAGPGAHRQAGLLLPGPPGGLARARTTSPTCSTASSSSWRRAEMPKRTDLESILIIGAGPIVIGQACEFDYSGAQACKALREEGYRVILVNSNPATIMTDPGMADATYIEPITWQVVEKIIAKERPTRCCPRWAARRR
jgi:hypothetical protein